MSVADLPLAEREALAESLSPERLASDRAAQLAADERAAERKRDNENEIREAIPATIVAVNEALLELTASMSALIEARAKYASARSAAAAIQSRARAAGIDVEVVPSYADLVLRDRAARQLNGEWLTTISSQIR